MFRFRCLGFGVWGLGFGVLGLGLWGLGFFKMKVVFDESGF